ncbi:hypothetical protein DRO60_02510 [Candidatus Bathyarchaeota archaeon]|nr:MAG: hypothetical protein DRO60_02510 [Candidatus Bathyarchaeota archaeon]
MKLEAVKLELPEGCNIIVGISHFIKSVEDLYEALVNSVPGIKFGIAFCEASGPCLVRREGTDEELVRVATENALRIAAGHVFVILLRDAYPINVLNAIKQVPEVCTILCATANPVKAVVFEDEDGNRALLGVIDGFRTKGVEGPEHVKERKEFLRKIGYKLAP